MPARVGINAYFLARNKTGVGTYTRELVRHLALIDNNVIDYTLYLPPACELPAEVTANSRFTVRRMHPPNRLLWIGAGFSIASRRDRLDVFHDQHHLPVGLRCKTIITVHDILFEKFPAIYSRADRTKLKLATRSACARANHIVTPSQTTKRDLVELYGRDPEDITVAHLGPAPQYQPVNRDVAKELIEAKYGVNGDFLLHVGLIHPRKNLLRLMEAFARLKRNSGPRYKLVLVGPRENFYAQFRERLFEKVSDLGLSSDVVWTEYVPAADLPAFYSAATLFVYPSLCEGFGLPVIEAMACGTPTVTSRGSSLEEVAGHAAVLVDPFSVSDIAAGLEKVLENDELRHELAEKGRTRASEFSYRRTAEDTRRAYEKLLG